MTNPTTGRTTRAQRIAMPLAREVVQDLAVEHGACIRPMQLRRTNLDTGEMEQVLVPCGHTLATVCPARAERARTLRAAQCREGWRLEAEPETEPDPATEDQRWWIETAPKPSGSVTRPPAAGRDTGDLKELVSELDDEIANGGIRGKVLLARPARRHRSTRRRKDTPDLPARTVNPRTIGKTTPRRTARPSGPRCSSRSPAPAMAGCGEDGTPADPGCL